MAASDYDVAVVGGGLVGVATAWGLAREGCRVVVLDEGDRAVRASRGNFALVWVQSKGLGLAPYAGWTIRSSNAWAGFAQTLKEETGLDVSFQRPGGFHLALSETGTGGARQHPEAPAQPAGRRRVQDRDPRPRVRSPRCCPISGPRWWAAATARSTATSIRCACSARLHTAINARGVTYLPSHRVEAIVKDGGEFRLATAQGEVRAGRVALAAGNANMRLAPMVGLEAPMKPERGQIVVTERLRPFLHYPVVTLRQTDEGTVMIGDSKEESVDPAGLTLGVSATEAERAVRQFPLLANVNVVRTWSAIRVMTQGRFPDLRRIGDASRRLHRLLPFRRDARGQSRAHHCADDRPRRPRQVAGRSLQCAEVPCSRGWLRRARRSRSPSTARRSAREPATPSPPPCWRPASTIAAPRR